MWLRCNRSGLQLHVYTCRRRETITIGTKVSLFRKILLRMRELKNSFYYCAGSLKLVSTFSNFCSVKKVVRNAGNLQVGWKQQRYKYTFINIAQKLENIWSAMRCWIVYILWIDSCYWRPWWVEILVFFQEFYNT